MAKSDNRTDEVDSRLPLNATRVERVLSLEHHPWVRVIAKVTVVLGALFGGAEAIYGRYDNFFLGPLREEEARRVAAEREGTAAPPKVELFFGDGNDRCSLRNMDVRPIREAIVWFSEARVNLTIGGAKIFVSSSRDYPRAREHELLPGDEVVGEWMGTGFLRDPHTLPLEPHGLGCAPDHDCIWAFECRSEYLRDADRRPFHQSKLSFVVNVEGEWVLRSVDEFFTTEISTNPTDHKSWVTEYRWNDDRIRKAFEIYSGERAARLELEEMFPVAASELPPLLPPTSR